MIYIKKYSYSNLKHGERKKAETVHGRELLKTAVLREFGIDSDTLTIAKGEHGKPYFSDREDICFNISHSGDFVAAAVGECPIGVDVQVVKKIHYGLVNKFCNYNEKEFISKSENKDRAFITLWSLKESYVKAIGKGLSYPVSEINFNLEHFDSEAVGEFSNQSGRFYVRDYGDFVLSACALGEFDFDVWEDFSGDILSTSFVMSDL